MYNELKRREAQGQVIEIGLAGAGAMGVAIAHQIGRTPGMRLSFVADRSLAAAQQAAAAYGKPTLASTDTLAALHDPRIACDVLVEATNSVVAAFDYCMAAIGRRAHCVLMNAEVDLILGRLLRHEARQKGVLVTSDAGDQHGVLARMVEEVQMWGFQIVQAGNMKGFLDRHRTLAGSVEIARSLRLSTQQCLAYTDGSKLNIEMAIIANQCGLTPLVPGMQGPRAQKVADVMDLFDFDSYAGQGRVDYVLGAREHGGGVYVVGRCDDPMQEWFLQYYKVTGRHPYYLFFRPYHLCHFETTRAVALAVLYGKPVCTMAAGRFADCYAFAKRALSPGEPVTHAIGSDEVYGLIDTAPQADARGMVPLGLLDVEDSAARPVLRRAVAPDQPLAWDDLELPPGRLLLLWRQQQDLPTAAAPA